MRRPRDGGDLVVRALGTVTVALFALALVFLFTDLSGASPWIGATGVFVLLMWARAADGNRRSKREH